MPDRFPHAQAVLMEAETELMDLDPRPFSPQAFRFLKTKISDYTRSLITESGRVAKRRRGDLISAAHVEHASEYLLSATKGRWSRHVGTLGGIFLGASMSNFLGMTSTGQYNAVGVTISASLAVLGAFGIAWHIGREA